jgi:hypothetical protein
MLGNLFDRFWGCCHSGGRTFNLPLSFPFSMLRPMRVLLPPLAIGQELNVERGTFMVYKPR